MEKTEFLGQQTKISNELTELYRQQDKKRDELNKLRDDWCQELCKQYEQYKGKRVKVVFEKASGNGTNIVRRECDGFIHGFSCKHRYTSDIMMDIAKVKKDGTPSKVLFPDWEMFSWQEIVSVTEVY